MSPEPKQGAGLKLLPNSASLNIFPPRLIQYLGGAFNIKVPPFFHSEHVLFTLVGIQFA